MTREEAIEQLSIVYLGEFDKDREAKDIAISALSDYDKMQKISLDLAFENDELMNKLSADGDCISRQAVLTIAKNSYLDLGKWEDCKVFCAEIRALPSVENKSKKGGEE